MPVKIGIDIGSSTTKIVAFEGEHMLPPMAVKADSQVASLYGAFGRYLYENNLELADVEGVYITGVGSKYVERYMIVLPIKWMNSSLQVPEDIILRIKRKSLSSVWVPEASSSK